MKSAAMFVLLSCASLIGAAEPSKDAAPQNDPQTKDPITEQDMLAALRAATTTPALRLTAEGQNRASAAAALAGISRNCYFMRVVQPADQPSVEPRWNEGASDTPRFVPLQSQAQARMRPLASTVVCSNEGAVRHAVRKLP